MALPPGVIEMIQVPEHRQCHTMSQQARTRIKYKVPARAKFGRLKVTVVTTGGTSAAKTFTVKRQARGFPERDLRSGGFCTGSQ